MAKEDQQTGGKEKGSPRTGWRGRGCPRNKKQPTKGDTIGELEQGMMRDTTENLKQGGKGKGKPN